MVKCVYCGREQHAFMGLHIFNNDGSTSYFCSSKCRLNSLKLGRDKKNLKWTEAFRIMRERAKTKAAEETLKESAAAKESKAEEKTAKKKSKK